jgi:predicted permease
MSAFVQAIRSLRRDLGAALFAVAIAGLGIGACVTVFSLCRALLFRPLPFPDPERLVWIANGTAENLSQQTVQVGNLLELRERSRTLSDVAAFSPFYGVGDIRLTGDGAPERVTGVPVTQGFFPLLGVRPLLGRFFDGVETRWNAPRTAVLSHGFWRRRFAGDPRMVGRAIRLDGEPVTVIGVLPASFDFAGTFTPGTPADLFLPFPLTPENDRRGNTLALIGRLRAGATIGAAQSEASTIGAGIRSGRVGDMWRNGLAPRLSPLRERVSGRTRTALFALSGAVAFLMLLVCANLSNLLLVRASARRRELAVRAALGADRFQLAGQLLEESLLLAAGGAALGLGLALAGTRLVARIEGTTIPLLQDVRVDGAVLCFAIFLAAITSLAAGLLPALRASMVDPSSVLAEGSRGSHGDHGGRIRRAIVVAEVALACALLAGAGLLSRSVRRVLDVDPGFAADHLIAVRVDPGRERKTALERRLYLDALMEAVRSVPGVRTAGLTDALPLGNNFGWRRWSASLPGAPSVARVEPLVRMIDAGYFSTMKIRLLAGRAVAASDEPASEPVAVVNEQLARALWPGQDPLGRLVQTGGADRRVVGVVGGVRYFALDRDVAPEIYIPLGQPGGFHSVDLVVRSDMPPAAMAASLRAALRRADPTLPLTEFRTMQDLVDRSLFARRFVAGLVAGFALFGLALAALGIYAVIAYAVSERTREIGIRMALGASPTKLLVRILGDTGLLVGLGLALGLPLSLMAAQGIRGLLYEVGWSEPITLVGTGLLLAGVAALATLLPARRATRVHPLVALRPDSA